MNLDGMMTQYQNNQHVAVYIVWFEKYRDCSNYTPGTDEFYQSVKRFLVVLTNIGPGKDAVDDIVDDYYNKWLSSVNVELNYVTQYTNDGCTIEEEEKIICKRRIHEVFKFIVQTIQDTGRGWPTQEEIQNFNITQQ